MLLLRQKCTKQTFRLLPDIMKIVQEYDVTEFPDKLFTRRIFLCVKAEINREKCERPIDLRATLWET